MAGCPKRIGSNKKHVSVIIQKKSNYSEKLWLAQFKKVYWIKSTNCNKLEVIWINKNPLRRFPFPLRRTYFLLKHRGPSVRGKSRVWALLNGLLKNNFAWLVIVNRWARRHDTDKVWDLDALNQQHTDLNQFLVFGSAE